MSDYMYMERNMQMAIIATQDEMGNEVHQVVRMRGMGANVIGWENTDDGRVSGTWKYEEVAHDAIMFVEEEQIVAWINEKGEVTFVK